MKYINKGLDEANVTVGRGPSHNETETVENEHTNEVREFQNKRYVSGAEACWRFRGNEIAERKPHVNRLQLHLQGEQTVYFDASNKDQAVERTEKSERTKLTSFFELNANSNEDDKQKLLYRELPEYYTWETKRRVWNKRKRQTIDGIPETIGRLYSIHPT